METNLRPLTLGEILDRTAQLYRTHFWLFAGISAVYSGSLLALSLLQIGVQEFFRAEHLTRYLIWVGGIGIMVQFLIMFLFGGLAVAANNRAVAWVHLGEPATIRGAYGSILPRTGRYLWLMTIIAMIIWTPLALAYGGYLSLLFFWIRPLTKGAMRNLSTNPAVAAGNQQATLMLGLATAAFGLVFLLAVAYAVVMGLRYSLAIAASVVENLKARQALRRSVDLSKGARGRIFVLALLVLVIQLGLVLMTQIAFIVMSFRQNGQLTVGARVLQQFVAFVTNTFIGPMYATGFTLFYYDQRVRKEGYDIEWMMEAAGLTVPVADALGEHEQSSSAYGGWPNGTSPLSEESSRTAVAATFQDAARDHPEHE
jgi:hypothetical protein